MIGLEFYKMSGHGNDFILVDNWDGQVGVADMPELTRAVCRRQNGVGADGMIFILRWAGRSGFRLALLQCRRQFGGNVRQRRSLRRPVRLFERDRTGGNELHDPGRYH